MSDDRSLEIAAELLPQLVRAHDAHEKLREYAKKELNTLREKLAGRAGQFREAMEVGHTSINDQVLKLTVVEQRWQDLEETRAELKDVSGALKEQLKTSIQKMRDLFAEANSAQLSLFKPSGSSTANAEDRPEEET